MRRDIAVVVTLAAALILGVPGPSRRADAQDGKPLRVVGEQTVKGFAFPESVAYDPEAKVLYVSEFGSELKPAEKDGKGRISRISLTGEVLDRQFLPAAGDVLNKPKGLWVEGDRLWVTDIDAVCKVLCVSDNRADLLVRVDPANFLGTSGDPQVTLSFQGRKLNPNGVYPAKDGSLLVVGFMAPDQPRGIHALGAAGEVETLVADLGRLDGVYEMDDGTLLVTEWNSGALLHWSPKGSGTLAQGIKGPADFCVVAETGGWLVVVPDLVQGELRFVRLAR